MPTSAWSSAACSGDELRRHWRGRARYTIVQTGFGDGAQFLHAWQTLLADADAPQRLHYLALVPQVPQREQLQPAPLWETFSGEWPPPVPGYHRLMQQQGPQQGRVVLTLIAGDVAESLAQLEAGIDCFLLRDDDLRSGSQIRRLGRLAAPHAQLAVQGAWQAERETWEVREELLQAGFVVQEGDPAGLRARFAPRWQLPASASEPIDRRAIVIGAGLAGSAMCESLAARGWEVALIEQHDQAAQEASGNLAGVYMPAVSRDDNPTARLTRAAFLFAQQAWARIGVFDAGRDIGTACGVLQIARDAEQADAFEQTARHWRYPPGYAQWLSAAEAGARLGMATGSGWFFPRGGWLRPAAICEAMLQACGARLQRHFGRPATALLHDGRQWRATDSAGNTLAQAPVAILANGMQSLGFSQAQSLPLQAIRGQVSHVPAALLPRLPFALCGDGYVTGAVGGMVSVGASYDQDDDTALRLDSHLANLARLRQMLPQLSPAMSGPDAVPMQGRVGFRCVSADRLPLVGALPDMAALAASGEVQLKDMPRQPQLYGLLAYASRGLIWSPLAAEILACRLEGEPAPLGKDLLALLDPARFALKAHRQRGKPKPQ